MPAMAIKYISDQSPTYIIKDSIVHGRGLYAARDIRKGERALEYVGEKISKAESERRAAIILERSRITGQGAVYIFTLNKTHDIDGSVDWNDARLVNHSCDPNCEAQIIRGRIWYIALRPIPEGTELSVNYGFDFENWEDHPCRCGMHNCVGFIVAEEHWPKLKRTIRKNSALERHRNTLIAQKKRAR